MVLYIGVKGYRCLLISLKMQFVPVPSCPCVIPKRRISLFHHLEAESPLMHFS